MGAILAALASIAAGIGLDRVTTWIEAQYNKASGVSADQIIATINKMTNEARAKGANALSELNNKLGAIQVPYGVSSHVKEAIMDTRRALANELRSTTKKVNEAEAKLVNVENRASNLAAQPEVVRSSIGKETLQSIQKDAQEATNVYNNLKGVETNA